MKKIFGNRFQVGQAGLFDKVYTLDNPSKRIDYRFSSLQEKEIDHISVYFRRAIGSPQIHLELRDDDGGNKHLPAENVLTQGKMYLFPHNWFWGVIPVKPFSLSKGKVYHIIVTCANGLEKSTLASMRSNFPLNDIWINDIENPYRDTLYSEDGGLTWNPGDGSEAREPLYVLEFTDGTKEGNPYCYTDSDDIYANVYCGQIFLGPKEPFHANSISFQVCRYGPNIPSDHLYYSIERVSDENRKGTEIAHGKVVDREQIESSRRWYKTELSDPLTLSDNKLYRVYLKSPESKYPNRYRIDPPATKGFIKGSGVFDNQPYGEELTWQGSHGRYTRSGHKGEIWELNYGLQDRADFVFYFE